MGGKSVSTHGKKGANPGIHSAREEPSQTLSFTSPKNEVSKVKPYEGGGGKGHSKGLSEDANYIVKPLSGN